MDRWASQIIPLLLEALARGETIKSTDFNHGERFMVPMTVLTKYQVGKHTKHAKLLKTFLETELGFAYMLGTSSLSISAAACQAMRDRYQHQQHLLPKPLQPLIHDGRSSNMVHAVRISTCVTHCTFQYNSWVSMPIMNATSLRSLIHSCAPSYATLGIKGLTLNPAALSTTLVQFQYAADRVILIDCAVAPTTFAFSAHSALKTCLELVQNVICCDTYYLTPVLGKDLLLACQCLDLQLAMEYVSGQALADLSQCARHLQLPSNPCKPPSADVYQQRPLSSNVLQYVLEDAKVLFSCSAKMLSSCHNLHISTGGTVLNMLIGSTLQRIHSHPASRMVCFSLALDYAMVSAELPEHLHPTSSSSVSSQADDATQQQQIVQMHCDLSSMLYFLPETFSEAVLADENAFHELEHRACDFVLDFGRRAYWTSLDAPNRYYLHADPSQLVSRLQLEHVCSHLSFGPDNRAVLDNQLHRISALRNKQGDIFALTMRVGRYFTGSSYMISDLLHHPAYRRCSILVLGVPGSGKTSLIREIARVLADKQNVCIVDTSNEICGDGDTPHHCVGNARRLMVSAMSNQHEVMIECVQNHTPSVMVIDEIGRPEEVRAAQTVKHRGVRLIASAHGDFRSLLKNHELNRLLGGVQNVTVGDALAKDKNGRKTQAERGGMPTFDIVIEVDKGQYNSCRVILNTANAVDNSLKGLSIPAQKRWRTHPAMAPTNAMSAGSQQGQQQVFVDLIDLA